ncbi:MAG: LssY C-terminal domain-containing protein [Candidatus Magasanikbacteria bacterium]|nr:LssY C-terminal domain-containing protein [Candidatus Magasanikbacteria bacterium]
MNLLKSLLQSFKKAIAANEDVQGLIKKYPRLASFFKQRTDRTKFIGLPVSIFAIAFLYVLFLFLGAIQDFVASDIIVNADTRVNALLYFFRNATAVKMFLWVTLLGKSSTIIVFTFSASLLLWFWNKRWQIATLWSSVIGSAAFVFISKIFFDRPRPINAVYLENSASFPSGHSTLAIAFYGFIAYLLIRKTKSLVFRAIIVLIEILLALAIGFSRLYLGVHYVSDVWAGFLLGLLWLIIAISISEWSLFKTQGVVNQNKPANKYKGVIAVGLIGFGLIFYVVSGIFYHPKLTFQTQAGVQTTISTAANVFSESGFSPYTETLTGESQEPISFIAVAKDDNALIAEFKKAGWLLADPVNFDSVLALAKSAILNKEYDAAPMTPSFWNKQVHNFGFEKSTETKSVRQRHHARFWKTNLKLATGENIYLGTASLDIGVKWFITHKISPDIDTERDLLFADLQKTGVVKSFEKIKSVSPVLGKNFSGDQFFTDGEAYLLFFY